MTRAVDAAAAEREHVVVDREDLEALFLQTCVDIDVVCHGQDASITEADQIAAEHNAVRIGHRNDPDVLILDEINVAVEWNLISLSGQLGLIEMKPADVEIVMTGRYASEAIIEAADLVTEMNEIKHYFETEKILARRGFEF